MVEITQYAQNRLSPARSGIENRWPKGKAKVKGVLIVSIAMGYELLPLQDVLIVSILWAKSFWAFSPFQPYCSIFFTFPIGEN